MVDTAQNELRRHLLIAGTGRAGTSFLVKYLTALGLDTTLARRGAAALWDEHANAGLEEEPFTKEIQDLPYVVKTPWLFQVIDQWLTRPEVKLDSVVIPTRDLVEAAAGRIINEIRNILQNVPWMTDAAQCWEVWGGAPGGAIYSLNPLDQARILAMGFHQLIERLVRADVPIIFLAFPRIIEDPDYLFTHMKAVLPPDVTIQMARDAHSRVADIHKVRVGPELQFDGALCQAGILAKFPDRERLSNIALRRELRHIRQESEASVLDATRVLEVKITELETLRAGQAALHQQHEALTHQRHADAVERERLVRENQALAVRCVALERAKNEADRKIASLEASVQTHTAESNASRILAEAHAKQARELDAALTATLSSRTWRATYPLRKLSCAIRHNLVRALRTKN